MTGLVSTVRNQVAGECLVTKCSKQGCSVSMQDAPHTRLIIDFDKPCSPLGPHQRRCDYLFVADVLRKPGWIVPLELKGGTVRASQVTEQLQAGAHAAELLVPNRMKANFRPVVVFRKHMHRAERKALKKNVRFHSCPEPVFLLRCGDRLTKVLRP